MENTESDELRVFVKGLILNLRMNYGYAMTQAGLDPEVIINVHHMANSYMLDWLKKS